MDFGTCCRFNFFNSLGSRDAYMHQSTRPSLVQIMAGRLIGAKPLPESVLPYHELEPKIHISVKFSLKLKNENS